MPVRNSKIARTLLGGKGALENVRFMYVSHVLQVLDNLRNVQDHLSHRENHIWSHLLHKAPLQCKAGLIFSFFEGHPIYPHSAVRVIRRLIPPVSLQPTDLVKVTRIKAYLSVCLPCLYYFLYFYYAQPSRYI